MRAVIALRGLLLALLVVLVACAKRAETSSEAYYYAEEADSYGDGGGYGRGAGGAPAAPAPRMEMAKMSADMAYPAEAPAMEQAGPSSGSEGGGEPPASPRMVHYNGYVQLKVTRPEDLVQQVVALAEAAGGYVERRSLGSVTVRVPVASFEQSFAACLALGEPLYRSITAEDVTEAFQDVALRLRTAQTTRARLQELLAKATEETEKLELLREIQRLTEEIDLMESRLRTLGALAAYSRITVEGTSRADTDGTGQLAEVQGFEFIEVLSPFHNDLVWLGRHRPLPVPEGMVALDLKRRFIAESADGAVLRAVRLPNDPEGDSAFWVAAVRERLEPEFAAVTEGTLGEYRTVRFEQAGEDDPYVYIVGVRADGRHLDVLELYYPSRAHEARNAPAVQAALTVEGS